MKKTLFTVLLFISSQALAIDAYSTADKGVQSVIKKIVEVIDAPQGIEVERKIFNVIEHAFEDVGIWNSYWLGYNDLSSSKIETSNLGFIKYFINTENSGMFFISLMYDKQSNQILLNRKQVRFASKGVVLNAFKDLKGDTENYRVAHEQDNYALLQENGKVDFSGFNISGDQGSVVYFDQIIIDL